MRCVGRINFSHEIVGYLISAAELLLKATSQCAKQISNCTTLSRLAVQHRVAWRLGAHGKFSVLYRHHEKKV